MIILLIIIVCKAKAGATPTFVEPTLIRCTVYCDSGVTKSGQHTRDGIVAMNKSMLGKGIVMYDKDMQFIGYYEVLDTGGNKDLKAGKRIDVYRETLEECNEWIRQYGDYVYIQIIDAKG